ncbi:hypothetical protein CBS101457_000153 [Exobasidium rhododendri]|nr:hypothetical protein CBS101457_000153 [Exobasidium rhododendri]
MHLSAPHTLCFVALLYDTIAAAPSPMFGWEGQQHGHISHSNELAPLPESLNLLSFDPTVLTPGYSDLGASYGYPNHFYPTDHELISGNDHRFSTMDYADPHLPGNITHQPSHFQPVTTTNYDDGPPSYSAAPPLQNSLDFPYHHLDSFGHAAHLQTLLPIRNNPYDAQHSVPHHDASSSAVQRPDMERVKRKAKGKKVVSSSRSDKAVKVTFSRLTASEIKAETKQMLRHFEEASLRLYNQPYPPPDDYIPQDAKEYTLQYEPGYTYTDSHEKEVYSKIGSDRRLVAADQIHRIRPYKMEYIRQQLRRKFMTAPLANELLSQDQHRVEAAVDVIFPMDDNTSRSFVPWMTGFSNAKRIQIVEKLAGATRQGADQLRELMIDSKTTPEEASRILNARTPEEVRGIARMMNLYHVQDADKGWAMGMSEMQRKALLQRMLLHGQTHPNMRYAYLSKDKVPEGYGLHMLRVDDAEFFNIIMWLRGQVGHQGR